MDWPEGFALDKGALSGKQIALIGMYENAPLPLNSDLV
jgi:hypothetical protein